MTRAGIGISTALDPQAAGRRASAEALEAAGAEGAVCAVVLGTAAHGAALEGAVASAAECLGTDTVVGGSVDGLIARDRFVAGNPGVAVLALAAEDDHGGLPGADGSGALVGGPGSAAESFLLRDLAGAEEYAGEEVLAHIGGSPEGGDLLLLFADSHALLARPLLASISEALAPTTVVGLGTSPIPGAGPLAWADGEVAGAALAGLLLRGAGPVWAGVGNACYPASGEMRVTRARGNWVLGLDGRPALDVYREIAGAPTGEELSPAARPLMAAVATESRSGRRGEGSCSGFLERGAYVVRDIVGIDPERRAFSVPEPMASGRALAFVRSDSQHAGAELEARLFADGMPAAALGLHFACATGAAAGLVRPGLAPPRLPFRLAGRLEGLPLIGGVGAYQIGPVPEPGRTRVCELLTHSEVLVLLGDRGGSREGGVAAGSASE